MSKGILARKVGMTQIFTPQGTSVPVTVLEAYMASKPAVAPTCL